MGVVLGGVEERDRAAAGEGAEMAEFVGVGLELGGVAAGELLPLGGVVGEPLAQRIGGGDVLEPEVDAGGGFGEAAGPEAVDEDAGAVGFGGVGVDAFGGDGGMDKNLFYRMGIPNVFLRNIKVRIFGGTGKRAGLMSS